jgi:hypothetical protein
MTPSQKSPTPAIVHQPGAPLYDRVVTGTLHSVKKPIPVAGYRLLPPRLKAQLPAASELKQVVAQVELPDEK